MLLLNNLKTAAVHNSKTATLGAIDMRGKMLQVLGVGGTIILQ